MTVGAVPRPGALREGGEGDTAVEVLRGGIVCAGRSGGGRWPCATPATSSARACPSSWTSSSGAPPAPPFLTGDFLRNPAFRPPVERLAAAGHYLGPHSDRRLLYCEWAAERPTRLSRDRLASDLQANLATIEGYGVPRQSVRLPLYNCRQGAACAAIDRSRPPG
jgi:hypothetical protein